MTSFSRRERDALCDLAIEVGAGAPTLCGDWTVRELLAHLVVRESDPLGAPGILLPPLAGLTDRAMQRLQRQSFEDLVARVRRPALWSPSRLAPFEALVNRIELFVHHEDVRRARLGWAPRPLDRRDQDAIWQLLGLLGRGLVRGAGVPGVVAVRTDGGGRHRLRGGADEVTVRGLPSEVTLFLYGRGAVADVELTGSDTAVARLRGADLGL